MSRASRNWIAYLCENLASTGMMPTWEAATYLTDNLFGDRPNPRLLRTACPFEDTTHFLHRLYQPLVAAATRDIPLPQAAMIHVFTDISLTGKSAVLVVYFPGQNQPHQLLLLDAAKAWAEERYHWIKTALTSVTAGLPVSPTIASPLEAVKN